MGEENSNKKSEVIEKIENELSKERTYWNKAISDMAVKIKDELRFAMHLEAEAVSRRQELTELIGNYSYEINKNMPLIKSKKKKLFEYYATKYQIKTNGTEKNKLIDADMSYAEAKIDAYKNHIDFLTDSRKSIDHIIYSVKNKIELYNITEMIG